MHLSRKKSELASSEHPKAYKEGLVASFAKGEIIPSVRDSYCLPDFPSVKVQGEVLAQMKSEAEHLQHFLQKTKVKIQRDFEAYWNSQRLSKPKRTPRRSPREVSRSTAGANLGEIPSLGKEGGNRGDRTGWLVQGQPGRLLQAMKV